MLIRKSSVVDHKLKYQEGLQPCFCILYWLTPRPRLFILEGKLVDHPH